MTYVPQAPEHALFQEHTTAMVTEVLLQLNRISGTASISPATFRHWLRLQTPTENISV